MTSKRRLLPIEFTEEQKATLNSLARREPECIACTNPRTGEGKDLCPECWAKRDDLVGRLELRAAIRRKTVRRIEPDRIADLLEEAAAEIKRSRERFFIGHDNSGHRYLVPVAKRAEFNAWSELPEDDERGWDEPDYVKRLDGRLTFALPETGS